MMNGANRLLMVSARSRSAYPDVPAQTYQRYLAYRYFPYSLRELLSFGSKDSELTGYIKVTLLAEPSYAESLRILDQLAA
jgi:hypothetical protein